MTSTHRRRALGLFAIGAVAGTGGLAGLYRASEFGGAQLRVIVACGSLAIGLICVCWAFVERRR